MTRAFIHLPSFLRSWAAMGLTDDDLVELENELLTNPQSGDVIEGTGGARKIRIRLKGRGKRGGGRVIYLDVFGQENLFLILSYPKNKQENLTQEQIAQIKRVVEYIKTR